MGVADDILLAAVLPPLQCVLLDSLQHEETGVAIRSCRVPQ